MNTHSTIPNDVRMSSTCGQSAWSFFLFSYLPNSPWQPESPSFGAGCLKMAASGGRLPLTFRQAPTSKELKTPSETKRSAFCSGKIKNCTNFQEWLVGITDGDGTFYFNRNKKGVWGFTFKIGQSNYNLRLLYYIKSMLGVGSVSVPNSKDNVAEYRVRDIQLIIQHILPIFDNYPLLTSKHFNYSIFR